MKLKLIGLALLFLFFQNGFSQNQKEYKSWNPKSIGFPVLEGQGWPNEVKNYYDRLPARAEALVRKEVWNLSENAAGLQLRFRTNAQEIVIKYGVTGEMQFSHMAATGVSGVDMYSKTIDGNWLWCAGKFSFGDTIVYRFSNLIANDQNVNNREYSLYLPLYNSVKWMEISVPEESMFEPLPVRTDKPIVVYGTSIAQGACASRPGLAWTALLGRKLDRPMINLGLSGNGRLEKEVLDLITELNAKLYVLDCLPNMVSPAFTENELKNRIAGAIQLLQSKRPGIPILLTDHAGYTDEGINAVRRKEYQDANTALHGIFDSLIAAGVKNIYRLSKEEINQDIETMVDGVHPNDIGMMRYAEAYEKKIRVILGEPVGKFSTTTPVSQRRDAAIYDWETRHEEVIAFNRAHSPQTVLIGNSITHYWGGLPAEPRAGGRNSWKKYFEPRNAVNMGFGWDRIENVLWRVYHGELDSINPNHIILMIGTNNLGFNNDEEIIQGLQFLIKAIQAKQPDAQILLLGILPRRNTEQRVAGFNARLASVKFNTKIHYADAGKLFLKQDKKIDESLFSDGLHPNEEGYGKLGKFIDSHLNLY
jgi:lysophospholipase L1-like esterase